MERKKTTGMLRQEKKFDKAWKCYSAVILGGSSWLHSNHSHVEFTGKNLLASKELLSTLVGPLHQGLIEPRHFFLVMIQCFEVSTKQVS